MQCCTVSPCKGLESIRLLSTFKHNFAVPNTTTSVVSNLSASSLRLTESRTFQTLADGCTSRIGMKGDGEGGWGYVDRRNRGTTVNTWHGGNRRTAGNQLTPRTGKLREQWNGRNSGTPWTGEEGQIDVWDGFFFFHTRFSITFILL